MDEVCDSHDPEVLPPHSLRPVFVEQHDVGMRSRLGTRIFGHVIAILLPAVGNVLPITVAVRGISRGRLRGVNVPFLCAGRVSHQWGGAFSSAADAEREVLCAAAGECLLAD